MIIAALEWLSEGIDRLVDAASRRGITVHLLTRDPGSYEGKLDRPVEELVVTEIDTYDIEAVRTHLEAVAGLAGLISTTDNWSLAALALAAGLGLPGQNPRGVPLVRDKAALRNRLYEHGLTRGPSFPFDPETITAAELARRLAYPAVVKDSAGTGCQNVWLVRSAADVEPVLAAARDAQLRGDLTAEPYFVGTLYSIETVTWDGETRVLGVSSRNLSPLPCFREDVKAFPVAFPGGLADTLDRWINGVLSAVSYTVGFAHTDFVITAGGLEVVEIDPRLGDGLTGPMICHTLGVNIYDAFLDMALGRRPALMDLPLTPACGAAEVKLYPPGTGRFLGYDGTQLLDDHPGDPVLHPALRPGQHIVAGSDVRGHTGSVFATGPTSEIAMLNAIAAAGKIRVRVEAVR